MRKNLPTIAVALLTAGLLVRASDLATPSAQAGPFRKAARIAKGAGKAITHVLPGHARRVERRHARMIGEYYATLPASPLGNSQPIGLILPAGLATLPNTPARCPGGICPYGTLPLPNAQ